MKKLYTSLVLTLIVITTFSQSPNISMTTTLSINSQISFTIRGNSTSTPIQIDWGNGVKENYTIGDMDEAFGFPVKGSTIKIWGQGVEGLNIQSKELTALEFYQATSFKTLFCKGNKLTTLNLSDCPALTLVECKQNQIISLTLPNTTTLTYVDCSDNSLNLASLPIKQAFWTDYIYSPQKDYVLPKTVYAVNEEIDLSSHLTINGNTTTYTWKTAGGVTLVNVIDYNETGGKFTFLKTYSESLFCEMTNATFPNLTLKTINISIPQLPAVIMATTTAIGNTFSFWITATTNSTPIQVDWGNGTISNYTIGVNNNIVNGILKGNTIKIYSTCISHLDVRSLELTALDVSNCLTLQSLICYNNKLTSLDMSKNIELKTLDCHSNRELRNIDVSNNLQLETFYCSGGQLTSIDISKNTVLKDFSCDDNKITTLDVSKNVELINLMCYWNKISSINISNNTALQKLWCFGNLLTSLDLSQNATLINLHCGNNQISSLNLKNNIHLTDLNCSMNNLNTLDVSKNTALITLDCCWNNIYTLDLSKNLQLSSLTCYRNILSSLDVSNNTLLKKLICHTNNLSFGTLPVKQSSWTTYEYSPQSNLSLSKKTYDLNEEIDLSSQFLVNGVETNYTWKTGSGITLAKNSDYSENNGKFTFTKDYGDYFYCQMTNANLPNLTLITDPIALNTPGPSISMALSPNTDRFLFYFQIGSTVDNSIIKIDWGNGTITSHNIGNTSNSIAQNNVGNVIKIYAPGNAYLNVSNCGIATIDISKCITLKTFDCRNNNLATLNLTNNTLLTSINCSSNQLTSLNLAGNVALSYIDCSQNKITNLDISNNPVLKNLYCSSNQLTFSTLPLKQSSWFTYVYSPQLKIKLAKKYYNISETVDLGSQLTANGNTTNYTWKTKGGTTLTPGTDFSVTDGVTTFHKGQTDSVYCQMTNATFPLLTLSTTNIKVSDPTSIDSDIEQITKVYPNPVSNLLWVVSEETIKRVEIYTVLGAKVFEQDYNTTLRININTADFPKGLLIIKIYGMNGVMEKKIVKE